MPPTKDDIVSTRIMGLDMRRIESLKQVGEVIGNRTRVKAVKNKIALPFKEMEFDIMFGQGISVEDNKIGQGRENTKQYFKDNSAECKKIITKLRKVSEIAKILIMGGYIKEEVFSMSIINIEESRASNQLKQEKCNEAKEAMRDILSEDQLGKFDGVFDDIIGKALRSVMLKERAEKD